MTLDAAAAPAAPATGRNPFANAGYRTWWLASVFTSMGVGIQLVAVPLFVRDRVDDEYRAIALAGAFLCQTVPAALLVLFGGVVADRIDRRRILVRAYAVATGASLVYVAISAADVRAVWPVFVLATAIGAAAAFSQPARQSTLPRILPDVQLHNGVVLGTAAWMAAMQFIGPGFAGFLVGARGVTAAFAAEAVLLAAGTLLFARLSPDPPVPSGRSVLEDLGGGLRYVRRHRAVLGLLAFATLPGIFFIAPLNVTMVLIVSDVLEVGDRYVGILIACFGAGVVLGSLALAWRPVPRRGLLLCASAVYGGVFFAAYGLSESVGLSMVILFFWGLGAAAFINMTLALLQGHADREMMGRVMSMYTLAFTASPAIGYVQAGLVTSLWGPQTTVVASGLAIVPIGLACLLFLRSVRSLP